MGELEQRRVKEIIIKKIINNNSEYKYAALK